MLDGDPAFDATPAGDSSGWSADQAREREVHYLDYAATSAIRPPAVAQAVSDFLQDVGASPGRGGYGRSVTSARIAFRCRRAVARLLGLPGDPGRIAFMMNATHALNTALHGILDRGDRVVVTPFDHNAVLRPVHVLARDRNVDVRMVPGDATGSVDLDTLGTLLEGARLLVVNHVSNVLGTVLPLEQMCSLARERGVLVLVDAAQSAGHLTASPAEAGADLVAFTGHKGLLGPQGTGGLWVREGVSVRPLLTGGTGGDSARREMPDALPDRLEAGTPNAPGLAGLLAGCEFVLERGVEQIHAHEMRLKNRLLEGMVAIPGIRVLSPPAGDGAALVTLVADRLSPSELARELEVGWGIMARSGLHCAPEAHRLLGSASDGALRLSLGWASSDQDVDRTLEALDAVAGPRPVPVTSAMPPT